MFVRHVAPRDQPVGPPPQRAADLLVGTDHHEHERTGAAKFGHQASIATERDDCGVDSLVDAYFDVATTDERHQQIDRDRAVADLIAHPANRRTQPVGGDPAQRPQATGLRDGDRQIDERRAQLMTESTVVVTTLSSKRLSISPMRSPQAQSSALRFQQ